MLEPEIQVEIGNHVVMTLHSSTVPSAKEVITVPTPLTKDDTGYNVKVIERHWILDHPSRGALERRLRCVLVCKRIVH